MQWHTPIGYSIRKGKIVVNEEQKKIVQQIFTNYDSGVSAVGIAKSLKEREIINAHGRVAWTHASVGRILENHNYLGTEYYPQIIDTELFERVQNRRNQTRKNLSRGKHRPSSKERILFGGILICGECGQPYSHLQPKNRKRTMAEPKWKCKNYVYQNRLSCAGGFITDKQVMEVCIKAINKIIENKKLIQDVRGTDEKVNRRFKEINNRISSTKTESSEEAMALLYERAAERYKTLQVNDTKQNTEEMLKILADRNKIESFDEELYRSLVRQIIVYKDSKVKVVFRNGSDIIIGYGENSDVREGEKHDS